MKLTNKQKVQEDQYSLPYHWFIAPDTAEGRVYFGYLSICLEELRRHFESQIGNLKVLDAGCGDGRFLKVLKDAGIGEVSGSDYSERSLAFGRLFVDGVEFKQADLTADTPPFLDNYFDAIFLIETLEHIEPEKINRLMKTLSRMLKPEGMLIVTVPSILLPVSKKHYQHFSSSSLTSALTPFFSVRKIMGQNKASLLFKNFYRLIDNRLYRIHFLSNYYNRKLWPRFFNRCEPERAERLIALSVKP